ncbi:Hypothetical protein NCS54_01498700 [Fusarium falciforme]|uniref:Hypothetical protein n=1 Tax=Fusarium falciforme TaxID=195108 RepID=UPI002300CB35|nr:Hypothetical protein NCS54_01498700 [Fusarium falciforme]WAO97269.1 Hypothetical protein NCS54_01498700 [Fusarium falciforme]
MLNVLFHCSSSKQSRFFSSHNGSTSLDRHLTFYGATAKYISNEAIPKDGQSVKPGATLHKMVDFALVVRPEKELQNLIDTFLDKQPHTMATINQTIYEPLRTRPAPIFIEIKTSSGNMDTANVQLGVWVAA